MNQFNRERTLSKIYATRRDCDEGYALYSKISESNEKGVPPHIYEFYLKCLKPLLSGEGLLRKEVSKAYREYYKTSIGDKALKRLVNVLAEAGLVYEQKDPEDKRFMKIYPVVEEIYTPEGGGENILELLTQTLRYMQNDEVFGPVEPPTLRERLGWEEAQFDSVLKEALEVGVIIEDVHGALVAGS